MLIGACNRIPNSRLQAALVGTVVDADGFCKDTPYSLAQFLGGIPPKKALHL